jgi:hypothetical protein
LVSEPQAPARGCLCESASFEQTPARWRLGLGHQQRLVGRSPQSVRCAYNPPESRNPRNGRESDGIAEKDALVTTAVRLTCALGALLLASAPARGDEPIATVLADFEDNTVAAAIGEATHTPVGDCDARFEANPARGQFSLAVTVGASSGGATATCQLQFQLPMPFAQAERIGTAAWINEGEAEVGFRMRDSKGALFETPRQPVKERRRWVRVTASLSAGELKPVARGGDAVNGAPVWPIEFDSFVVGTKSTARQVVFLDDLHIEHHAPAEETVRARFYFDRQTHLYAPGATITTRLTLENSSRSAALKQLSAELAWYRSDGSEISRSKHAVNLPASAADYRARQSVDLQQKIDETGLFRLVATLTSPGWKRPAVYETTIAVTPSNRSIPRGRSVFFGIQANLLREPAEDRVLEIDVAKELGVQLFAITLPWRSIEPRRDAFEFAALDALVDAIVARDMACMLSLTEPPAWLAEADRTAQTERQTAALRAVAKRYGRKLHFIQPMAEPDVAAAVAFAEGLQKLLAADGAAAEVLPAPFAIHTPDGLPSELPAALREIDTPLLFQTYDDPVAARPRLAAFRERNKLTWKPAHVWMHVAPANGEAGSLADAVAVLRYCMVASAAGVRAVIWSDLRDDTSDPRHPEQMHGLLRRDFSPKSALLGYANAIGMLAGLVCKGQVDGTPDEFDSAMFVANERQVAAFVPKPNRVLPLAIAPVQAVEGRMTVLDFERRVRAPLDAASGLYQPIDRPFFVLLLPSEAKESPQISLAKPWVRAPATVFCDRSATITVEIDATPTFGLKFAQLVLPAKAGIKSSFSAKDLKPEAGKTVKIPIELTTEKPLAGPFTASLRISTAAGNLDAPIEIRPLGALLPGAASVPPNDRSLRIGEMAPASESPQRLGVFASYQAKTLTVALEHPADAPEGAELRFGIAVEGRETVREIAISGLGRDLTLRSLSATSGLSAGIRCAAGGKGSTPFVTLEIPAAALGVEEWKADLRICAGAAYVTPANTRAAVPSMRWGNGLDGSRTTQAFEWLRLGTASK